MKVFVAVAFLQRRHDLLFVVTTKFVFHRNQSVLFGWLLAALAAFRFFAFFYVMLEAIHKTSGASDTIFIKLRSRNSRATGPKIRVPRGFKSLSIITMALLSKRSNEPSSRRIGCFVRTRTARTTSPFLTDPVGLASFTLAVITSPMPA